MSEVNGTPVSRKAILNAAWAAPVVLAAIATPAVAASRNFAIYTSDAANSQWTGYRFDSGQLYVTGLQLYFTVRYNGPYGDPAPPDVETFTYVIRFDFSVAEWGDATYEVPQGFSGQITSISRSVDSEGATYTLTGVGPIPRYGSTGLRLLLSWDDPRPVLEPRGGATFTAVFDSPEIRDPVTRSGGITRAID